MEAAVSKHVSWTLHAPHGSGAGARGEIAGSVQLDNEDGSTSAFLLVRNPNGKGGFLALDDEGRLGSPIEIRHVATIDGV